MSCDNATELEKVKTWLALNEGVTKFLIMLSVKVTVASESGEDIIFVAFGVSIVINHETKDIHSG